MIKIIGLGAAAVVAIAPAVAGLVGNPSLSQQVPVQNVQHSTSSVHPEPGDDRRGVEPGDDRGREAEPGDDRGREAEPGDDRGREVEPGDDRGREAEPGDDRSGAGSTTSGPSMDTGSTTSGPSAGTGSTAPTAPQPGDDRGGSGGGGGADDPSGHH